MGIVPTLSSLGLKYYVTFIYDNTCITWIYFVRQKYEVLFIFQMFYRPIKTQFGKSKNHSF